MAADNGEQRPIEILSARAIFHWMLPLGSCGCDERLGRGGSLDRGFSAVAVLLQVGIFLIVIGFHNIAHDGAGGGAAVQSYRPEPGPPPQFPDCAAARIRQTSRSILSFLAHFGCQLEAHQLRRAGLSGEVNVLKLASRIAVPPASFTTPYMPSRDLLDCIVRKREMIRLSGCVDSSAGAAEPACRRWPPPQSCGRAESAWRSPRLGRSRPKSFPRDTICGDKRAAPILRKESARVLRSANRCRCAGRGRARWRNRECGRCPAACRRCRRTRRRKRRWP